MPADRKIKTTGDLRILLADTIGKVESGSIKPDDARVIHKLAHAINDSFFAESKIAALQVQLMQEVKSFGQMPLSGDQTRRLARVA